MVYRSKSNGKRDMAKSMRPLPCLTKRQKAKQTFSAKTELSQKSSYSLVVVKKCSNHYPTFTTSLIALQTTNYNVVTKSLNLNTANPSSHIKPTIYASLKLILHISSSSNVKDSFLMFTLMPISKL